MEFPSGEYEVVLVDPPWSYYGSQDKWGAASKFYKTMLDDEILSFPVMGLMAKRSVLFLWATSPRLSLALRCIEHWGLYFRGVGFVWVKTSKSGVPYGARGVRPSVVKPLTEFVLVGSTVKNGRPLPLGSEAVQQTIFAPVREHSRKPNEVHERIEALYPNASRIELFSRFNRNGWDTWGDEVGKFNDQPLSLER